MAQQNAKSKKIDKQKLIATKCDSILWSKPYIDNKAPTAVKQLKHLSGRVNQQ